MGAVYAAYDSDLGRRVALKLLSPTRPGANDESPARSRLLREAQAMARLSHPNVLTVYDVVTYEGGVALAMELAPGGTLRAWLRQTSRDVAEILSVFAQAGRGLAAAHSAGIVHRDFKPSNVMLAADGRVLVGDFGLARFFERGSRSAAQTIAVSEPQDAGEKTLTGSGQALGTPAYMAPEQLCGREVTPQSDQFAFCVSLYEALYGKRPFVGRNFEELQNNILSGRVTPAPVTRDVPGWLRRAVLRGLSPDPAARHPSMHSLVSVLTRDRVHTRDSGLLAAAALLIAGLAAAGGQASPGASDLCTAGRQLCSSGRNAGDGEVMAAALTATGRPLAEGSAAGRRRPMADAGLASPRESQEACDARPARGRQSLDALDRRMVCLSERLDAVAGLTEVLASARTRIVDEVIDGQAGR